MISAAAVSSLRHSSRPCGGRKKPRARSEIIIVLSSRLRASCFLPQAKQTDAIPLHVSAKLRQSLAGTVSGVCAAAVQQQEPFTCRLGATPVLGDVTGAAGHSHVSSSPNLPSRGFSGTKSLGIFTQYVMSSAAWHFISIRSIHVKGISAVLCYLTTWWH